VRLLGQPQGAYSEEWRGSEVETVQLFQSNESRYSGFDGCDTFDSFVDGQSERNVTKLVYNLLWRVAAVHDGRAKTVVSASDVPDGRAQCIHLKLAFEAEGYQ
jgi:hypothetical protein